MVFQQNEARWSLFLFSGDCGIKVCYTVCIFMQRYVETGKEHASLSFSLPLTHSLCLFQVSGKCCHQTLCGITFVKFLTKGKQQKFNTANKSCLP